MAEPPEIRIGTAEREQALEQLGKHFSDGRLTVAEFDERSGAITAATTRGELVQVFADLPAEPGTPATAPAKATSAPAERDSPPDWAGRVMAVVPLIALVLFFVTHSWLWFLAVPIAGAVLYGGDRERRKRTRKRDRRGGD
ncbi:DUF1707 domain-containing protein [Rhodococcus spelaei]|uniref:DUF1707 domain-containing protein n=1 Tax=Rhodococcus spelaei TaxID=2546320 RepID=A0A541B141_9NOCA|nr:DUF1707 domain-containing protein [Rhodococcus spelaei]TQF66022.1 DUF1707 domain-containing protein [Rhodococcus spelaei]